MRVGDDTDRLVFGFENRTLLDMQFERGMQRTAAARHIARIADALQFLADRLAVDVLARQTVVEREHAGEHARRHHRRREARAFLVGPDHDFDRMLGLDAVIVERADHFEPAEHAVDAVEAAAGRLRVRVRAGHDRQRIGVASRAAHEHVAHLIDADRAARFLRPADDQVASLLVEVGQRETADAALRRRADFRHRHQAVPQTLAVDLDRRIESSVSIASVTAFIRLAPLNRM